MRAIHCGLLVYSSIALACARGGQPYRPPTPLGLDEYYPVPEDNGLTRERVELGRRLFFDRRLSADRTIACASCHRAEHAFSDTVPKAVGVYGRMGRRNAPALVNLAYARSFFWDGRTETLEEQVLRPIQDSLEMALPLEELVARLARDRAYRRGFHRAFGRGVSADNVARALASYVRTLRVGGSPVDRFRAGDTTALSPEAQRGFRLFIGKANCTACHVGPNFTDEQFHNTGVSWGSGDLGRFAVTGLEADRGRFSTPTLREVACTAPYMHDGSVPTLEKVVEFYDRGATPNPNRDPEIQPLRLKNEERSALVAFLRSSAPCPGFSGATGSTPAANPRSRARARRAGTLSGARRGRC